MSRRRQVVCNTRIDRANANKTAFNAEFQDFIAPYAWGEAGEILKEVAVARD